MNTEIPDSVVRMHPYIQPSVWMRLSEYRYRAEHPNAQAVVTGRDPVRGDRRPGREGRLRPVVEAAQAWRRMRDGTPTTPKPESAALIAAVEAYEAGGEVR